MPDLLIMIGAVSIVTEFLKAALRNLFKIEPTSALKIILAVIGSICIVAYYAIMTGTPIGIGLIWILIQVIAGAVFGYKIVMKFRRDKKAPHV